MRNASKLNAALIGIPDHQGVYHVGGRVGAARGPEAFRKQFARFSAREGLATRLRDFGDVTGIGLDVRMNLDRARTAIADIHRAAERSLIIGGGNDHAWAQLSGVIQALSKNGKPPRIGCINVDAHLDVRKPNPHITSGSPFYLALEEGLIRGADFVEFGTQAHCNAAPLWDFVNKHGVKVLRWEELRDGRAVGAFQRTLQALAKRVDAVVVCFDLDSVASNDAPGVSAPQAEGLSASEAIQIAEICGKKKDVCSLGVFELNPEHDDKDRTARLAATMAWHWVMA